MQVIAHRGNNKEALENSFTAYDKAVECGAIRIELDIQLTRDGHPVINHDDHLLHTTGKNLYCSNLDRSEFRRIPLLNGDPVPFLDEVLERYLPKIELNIELKGNLIATGANTAKVVTKSKYSDKIIFSSFCPEPLLAVRDKLPNVQRACLIGDDDIPWPQFSHLAVLNFMNMVGASIVHPRAGMVSEQFMDQAESRGWKVFTWSTMAGEDESKESVWTILKTLGVHGHCTNYPRELIKWLHESEMYDRKVKEIFKSI